MTPLYYNEIGRLLKETREDLRLTLHETSTALHIRAHYLQALEEGTLGDLPGAAYVRGYLQSYAIFLHLDKDEILRRFERIEDDLPHKGLFFPQVFSKDKHPSYLFIWGGAGIAFVAYLLWFFLFNPEIVALTVVTPPPNRERTYEVSSNFSVLKLSCATVRIQLYPPCHRVDNGRFIKKPLLPAHRKIKSIMELAK